MSGGGVCEGEGVTTQRLGGWCEGGGVTTKRLGGGWCEWRRDVGVRCLLHDHLLTRWGTVKGCTLVTILVHGECAQRTCPICEHVVQAFTVLVSFDPRQ